MYSSAEKSLGLSNPSDLGQPEIRRSEYWQLGRHNCHHRLVKERNHALALEYTIGSEQKLVKRIQIGNMKENLIQDPVKKKGSHPVRVRRDCHPLIASL